MDPPATPPVLAGHASPGHSEGRIARGLRLARTSCEVLAGDRRLLLLPLLATLCALAALGAAAVLVLPLPDSPSSAELIVALWGAAYVVSFATIFFNVALIHVIACRWRGEPAELSDGLAAARRRIATIAGWAMLTTTVGLLLRLLERATFGISEIVFGIVADAAWSIASFFVVPVLVLEDRSPVGALRRSLQVVRGRWVEGLAGATPIALATLMLMLPISSLFVTGLLLYVFGLAVPGALAMIVAAIAGVAVTVVGIALTEIFTLAVYQHATAGTSPVGFAASDLERPRDGKPLRLAQRLRARRSS